MQIEFAGLDGRTVNVKKDDPGPIAGAFTIVCDPWAMSGIHPAGLGRKTWHIP